MTTNNRANQCIRAATKAALLSVSYLALVAASPDGVRAQTSSRAQQSPAATSQPPSAPPAAPAQEAPPSQPEYASSPSAAPAGQPSTGEPGEAPLPPVTVNPPRQKPKSKTTERASGQSAARPSARRAVKPSAAVPVAMAPNAIQAAWPASQTQNARTGTSGIYTNSTSVATKVNTPIVNIPQSLTVVTREFINDTSFQNLSDITRYVPGVDVHQGEGNRDELIIRGVDSSANFFVNGFRDDVQYFRDLYNVQSVEILKGPSAITFGRGVGGGLLNRTLKEADGQKIYEATAQTGSYNDRRFTVDAGQAISDTVATRFNAMYEGSDAFRQYNWLERYGVNPTMTFLPNDTTKIRLSYEYFHDARTADRGNPSQALSPVSPPSTKFNPAVPFAPNGDMTVFFGSPTLNVTRADLQTVMGFIDHDFENGWTVKNGTYYSNAVRYYQNAYPGNGPLAGAVNPSDTTFNLAAYNHTTNRDIFFDQTDFFYKTFTGPLFHSIAFGSEVGREAGIDVRNTGIFPNGTSTTIDNPFSPTYFGTVNFIHQFPGAFSPGVTTPDSDSKYTLNTQSAYARDTIEVTRFLQFIVAGRFDHFDESAIDVNMNQRRARTDTFISPQAAVIFKPTENMSIYGAYMVSYLPASGDQFSALTDGSVILAPQKFVNKEVGFKWNIFPRLIFTSSLYKLDRTNVPLADPTNPGFFILSGSNVIKGFESELKGYVTDSWQSWVGYAYTDARVTSDTSATIVAGNRVQLVPFNQFSWWNKYQFNPVWAASLGVIYFSDSFASSDDTVRLPGFVRFDGGVYATIDEHWKAQISIENILNTAYWATADGNNNISPGQGRTIRAKLTAKL
jgi:catecholate siderophore receptor